MKKRFLVTQDFKSPYITIIGYGSRPHKLEYKSFRRGQTIVGKIHYRKGKPAFVMIDETLVVPLNVIKQIQGNDIITHEADGTSSADGATNNPIPIVVNNSKISKQKYVIAAIVGALAGFGINHYAQKKAYWLPEDKNKYIAMAIGGAALAYILYLCSPTPKQPDTEIKKNL